MDSLYQQHVRRWRNCRLCSLCEGRQRVVLARGKIRCDILLVGEGPGQSEDILGAPFVGPAGKLLDHIIKQSTPPSIHWAMTNLVACIPRDESGDKTAEPEPEAIDACRPRLEEFIRIADPRLIICVGKLAEEYLKQGYRHSIKLPRRDLPLVAIIHPAAILRASIAQKGLAVQRAIVTVRNAVESLEAHKKEGASYESRHRTEKDQC